MTRNSPLPAAFRRRFIGLCAGLACAGAVCGAAEAQTRQAPQTPTAPAANATKSGHDSPGRLSKFEARHIRHHCRDRANERSLKGAERDAFLTKCFFGRASHRTLRRECAQQGEARGLEKAALREFTRECVKERSRQKE